ncbi:MAG TPA: hypothetical protein VNW29_02100 [Candidatus Sulfotelmatobacter sp.]|jgi:hypothetical protein|nr:hypothetical protein [Candidatus Sulfotelmatobacter sp.]
MSPFVASLAGIIAGATAVSVLALSDKAIREKALKKAKKVTDELQKWSTKKLNTSDTYEELKEKTERTNAPYIKDEPINK